MKKESYEIQAINLIKAIDIAIDAFNKFPPEKFHPEHIEHTINCYLDWKNNILNAESEYKNLKSLKYDIENVFTFFQESSGKTVEYFWDSIRNNNLPYKRENKLAKILKRKKIKNNVEYNFITDVLVPYQQEGLINLDEVTIINKLLIEYKKRGEK